MFDPRPDLGRPDRGILAALAPARAPASDPLIAAAQALAAACAASDPAAIGAAVRRIEDIRAGGAAGSPRVVIIAPPIEGYDVDAVLDQLDRERRAMKRLNLFFDGETA